MHKPMFRVAPGVCVLYFDTEQSPHDVQAQGRKILRIIGKGKQSRLRVYTLRGLSPPEKRLLLLKIVSSYNSGRLVIVIDNVRDLLHNINDQTEALITILMIQQLCSMGHHVMIVLHTTRGGDFLGRGAIGSEAHNRSELTIEVVKQGEISIVKALLARGKPFEDFAIGLNKEQEPVIVQDWIKKTAKKAGTHGAKKIDPAETPQDKHRKILEKFMLNEDGRKWRLSRIKMVEKMKESYAQAGIGFGDSKAREFIKFLEEKKLIVRLRLGQPSGEMFEITNKPG